ncbi:exonuclease V [Amylostereum chailletii]|nr:exonuclease V [Amylostereum chailletii]
MRIHCRPLPCLSRAQTSSTPTIFQSSQRTTSLPSTLALPLQHRCLTLVCSHPLSRPHLSRRRHYNAQIPSPSLASRSAGLSTASGSSRAGGKRANIWVGKIGVSTPAVSPFQQFRRWRKTLSVSDLVGPSWCEVQFDYGLRQGRAGKLEDRPASFVTAQGKVIEVEKNTAVQNDKVTKSGRSVHKKLEKQIRPEELVVETTTDEERWALRLVNMIASLDCLMNLGVCREMPVFGLVKNQIIIGIIDEIVRDSKTDAEDDSPVNKSGKRPTSSTHQTPKKVKKRRTPSPISPKLPSFGFYPLKRPVTPQPKSHILHVSDTKTRRNRGLPSHDDALGSRLQLMLYHRLLSGLLSPDFDFNTIWEKLQIDRFRRLSDKFLKQAGLRTTPSKDIDIDIDVGFPQCLDDLVDVWHTSRDMLNVSHVDPRLEIVYRSQPGSGWRGEDKDLDEPARDIPGVERAIEASLRGHDVELQRAIEASLLESGVGRTLVESSREETSMMGVGIDAFMPPLGGEALGSRGDIAWVAQGNSLEEAIPEVVEAVVEAVEQEGGGERAVGFVGKPEEPTVLEDKSASSEKDDNDVSLRIIGRTNFSMDDHILDDYLQKVLSWWHGSRLPTGVDEEHTMRCNSCEYREGCEWREKKAKDVSGRLGGIREEPESRTLESVDVVSSMF